MAPDLIAGNGAVVMGVTHQVRGAKDFHPFGVLLGIALAAAGFEGCRRREIAGEMAGIDIHALDHAGPPKTDGAMVVAFAALAPAFPAIHPFAVVVVFAGDEDGGLG